MKELEIHEDVTLESLSRQQRIMTAMMSEVNPNLSAVRNRVEQFTLSLGRYLDYFDVNPVLEKVVGTHILLRQSNWELKLNYPYEEGIVTSPSSNDLLLRPETVTTTLPDGKTRTDVLGWRYKGDFYANGCFGKTKFTSYE